MKKTTLALAIICPVTSFAGGFERNDQVPNFLFNDGRYVEFGIKSVNPDVDGTLTAAPGVAFDSKDMAGAYSTMSIYYKAQINDKLDWGLSYTQPYGAEVKYPSYTQPQDFYPLSTSVAELESQALTALLKYPSTAAGYVLGAAFEKKDIALRVALTYNSEVEHTNDVVEAVTGAIPETASQVTTTLPSSINLSFQSGVTPKTLVFGSIQQVEWTVTEIAPAVYQQATGNKLVDHANDSTTYTLGLAQRLNDTLAVALIYSTEEATGDTSPNLAPTDGFNSLTLAATLTEGNSKVTAGISHVDIGDTETVLGDGSPAFSGNSALGLGFSVAYNF